MKIFFLLPIGLLSILIIQAQSKPGKNSIAGMVTDSVSKLPLEYATISLFIKGNKSPVSGTITDKDGKYILTGIPNGKYTIDFEFIGYTTVKTIDLTITGNQPITKNISLSPQKENLQGVTVVATQKIIDNRIDKMVFNAEKDISSQSGSATDVLKKVPQVSVDVDGNVQLAGSGGVRFLINGKPSTAFGSSIADFLQSIPASQIKSIEVITNPGAKYDAQSLGGIINIILKTNNSQGYNGNLSLTAGTLMENGSFNLNVRKNNIGFNAFVSGNKRLTSTTHTTSERLTTNDSLKSSLLQQGEGEFERHGLQTGLGFDWTYKKYNSFTANIAYNNFGFSGNGLINQALTEDISNPFSQVLSTINSNNTHQYNGTDVSINYKRTFAKEDQELEIGVNSSFGNDKGRSGNEQSLLPKDSIFYGTQSYNPAKTRETQINIDYTQPLKKDVLLGVGGKATFYDISSASAYLRYQPSSELFLPDSSLINNLDYQQKVLAVYAELSFPVGKWFLAKIGGRYERTDINSYYSNAQQQASTPGYNTLVPSVFLSKKLDDKQTVKLSYTKRIERPGYDELNPFVNTNDPKNLSAGNPNLLPETGNRFELGYNRDLGKLGSFMVNLGYRINNNDIQPYIVYYPSFVVGDSTYTDVSVNIRRNIGTEKNLGISLFGDLHLGGKVNIRSNVFLFRRHTTNKVDPAYSYNSFNYRFNLNANYQFTNTLVAEFFGNFNSARHEAQGSYPSFTSYTFAVRKQFWKKKGSLALSANNFLKEYVDQRTQLIGPNFTLNSLRQIPFRSVSLNFTWKFGKLEFKNEKKETEINSPAEQSN